MLCVNANPMSGISLAPCGRLCALGLIWRRPTDGEDHVSERSENAQRRPGEKLRAAL